MGLRKIEYLVLRKLFFSQNVLKVKWLFGEFGEISKPCEGGRHDQTHTKK